MKWLFIQTENSNRRLQFDLKNIVSALALTPDEVASVDQHLFIHTLENDRDCFLSLSNPANFAAVNSLVQEVQPDFLVWDPLNSFTDNDLNSDMDMRAIISSISGIARAGNPNRVPLVLHHSLTGKIGAARAVGWDKASYGRNSKVLQAWTRAQINLAPRSADDPNLLIMSCGKNNNGRPFPEVGIRFDEQLGIYAKDDSFDPEEFRQEVGIGASRHKAVTADDVAACCEDDIPSTKLVARIKEDFGIQQRAAYDAISRAVATGLIKKNKGKNWNSTYSRIPQERRSYDGN
jgi:RecA-family ATPase